MKTMEEINAEYTKACDDYFESRYPRMISLFCGFFEDNWDYTEEDWEFAALLNRVAEYYGENPYQDKIDEIGKRDFETANFNMTIDKFADLLMNFFEDNKERVNLDYESILLIGLLKLKTVWAVKVKGIAVYHDTTKEDYKEQLFEGVKAVRKELMHLFTNLTYALGKRPVKDELEYMEEYLKEA